MASTRFRFLIPLGCRRCSSIRLSSADSPPFRIRQNWDSCSEKSIQRTLDITGVKIRYVIKSDTDPPRILMQRKDILADISFGERIAEDEVGALASYFVE